MTYQFVIDNLEASPGGTPSLVLRSTTSDTTLRVRLTPMEAQALATELAGISTVRSRLAGTCWRLINVLQATPVGIELYCGSGNLVEAHIVVAAGMEHLRLPVTFGDGIALALANHLPLGGDSSLAALLQDPLVEEIQPVPQMFEAFLNSLPDL